MKKSIIALSVIALTCSMGTFAKGQGGGGQGGGQGGGDYWSKKSYVVDPNFEYEKEVELLGFIPRKCEAKFYAERRLTKYHGGATYVELTSKEPQKLGQLKVECNLPKTVVTVSPLTDGKFKNPNSKYVSDTRYDLSFDQRYGWTDGYKDLKAYKIWDYDFKKDLYIKVDRQPKTHGIYNAKFRIDVESSFL